MLPPFDSDLMRSFLALAETGSVTAAAVRLGRTQSAVSMQLRRLEEVAGRPLFHRLPRGIALTEVGVNLLPYARQVADLLETARRTLHERPAETPLRLGLPPEYCETLLPRILARFEACHPQVGLTIRCDYSVPSITALEAGELDMAVVFDTVLQPGQGELLALDPTVWVTSEVHGQHLRRPVPNATYLASDWCQTHMLGSLERRGIAYRPVFACDTTQGFWTAVRMGLAVVALARSTIPEGCRELTEEDGFPLVDASCVILRRRAGADGAALRTLATILRAAFAETGEKAGLPPHP